MAILLPMTKEVDEVFDLGDLRLRESADLLEKVLFSERVCHVAYGTAVGGSPLMTNVPGFYGTRLAFYPWTLFLEALFL